VRGEKGALRCRPFAFADVLRRHEALVFRPFYNVLFGLRWAGLRESPVDEFAEARQEAAGSIDPAQEDCQFSATGKTLVSGSAESVTRRKIHADE
jgi:hypothetical protein